MTFEFDIQQWRKARITQHCNVIKDNLLHKCAGYDVTSSSLQNVIEYCIKLCKTGTARRRANKTRPQMDATISDIHRRNVFSDFQPEWCNVLLGPTDWRASWSIPPLDAAQKDQQ